MTLGPAWLKILIGNTDGGIESTFSKFVNNTKQCGAGDTQKEMAAIQKGLDRLEKRTCANHMKFNKAKYKVLHLGWGKPKHKYKLSRE